MFVWSYTNLSTIPITYNEITSFGIGMLVKIFRLISAHHGHRCQYDIALEVNSQYSIEKEC